MGAGASGPAEVTILIVISDAPSLIDRYSSAAIRNTASAAHGHADAILRYQAARRHVLRAVLAVFLWLAR